MVKNKFGTTFLRATALFVAAAISLTAVFGCNIAEITEEIILQELRSDSNAVSVKSASLDYDEFKLRYGFSQLNDSERAVYSAIKEAVYSFGSVSASGCDYDTFKKVFVVFCSDFPECFWITGDWSVSGYVSGGTKKYTSYTPSYRYFEEEREGIEDKIDAVVDKFLKTIPKSASDYDKMLAVYNFVATYAEYDSKTANKLSEGKVDESADRSCSIEGFFIDRLSVCSGFSKATQLLLHRLGIECAYVTGKSDGVGHSWNMAKLDGDYYYIDTTWANTRSEGIEHITYDFFCLSSEELAYDHLIESEIEFPKCTATKLNYYIYNDLVAESCDEDELARVFRRALDLGSGSVAAIKFASSKLFDEACRMLFESGGIFNVLNKIDGITCQSLKYSYDMGRLTVTVYLDN